MDAKILVVDDDLSVRKLLEDFLSTRGYKVYLAANGAGMAQAIDKYKLDLIVLDLSLPDEDGIELTRKLRTHSDLPIIMVTGRIDEIDRIVGLEIGADDYLPKPFSLHELEARIKSVLRRTKSTRRVDTEEQPDDNTLLFAGWTLNLGTRKLFSKHQEEVDLTAGEFNLLTAFVKHRNRVLSRDQLLEYSHNEADDSLWRSIDVQVMRLRGKIEDNPKRPVLIKTVRTAGYIFTPKVQQS